MEHLEDPDSFPGRCRDPNARQLVLEAVRSHQTGAQRAAIVATWIAVVYDLFGKLRELAQTGDGQAKAKIEEIDNAVDSHDIAAAQRIESTILKDARDKFGLLSANELQDLERLYEDRHRCAHPSLNRPEEVYVPAPELVRLHLANAISHLLTQPPVQGRAALQHLQQEVDSDLFPKRTEDAAEYLRNGIYRRMKPALVRDFCSAVIASCLNDPSVSQNQFARRMRGINALRMISPEPVNEALRDKLTQSARRVPNAGVHRIVQLVASVADSCSRLEEDVLLRARTYIANADSGELVQVIRYALVVSEFAEVARSRVADLTHSALKQIFSEEEQEHLFNFSSPPPEIFGQVVELYASSSSWNNSNALANTLVVPYALLMTPSDASRILSAYLENQELYHSTTRVEVLRAIQAHGKPSEDVMAAVLAKCQLSQSDLDPE